MNWSPNLMLAIARARVKGKNPAEAVARIFAKSTLELRSGAEEVWDGSTVLGTADVRFVKNTPTSVNTTNFAEIKISQAGLFNWFCVRSKRNPQMYWVESAEKLYSSLPLPGYQLRGREVTVHSLQISEIK